MPPNKIIVPSKNKKIHNKIFKNYFVINKR